MNFSVCKSYFRVLAQGFSLMELFNLSMEGYSHARLISVCVSLILLLYYVYLEKGKEVPIRHKVIGCLLILPYIAFELYSTYADKSWWIDYQSTSKTLLTSKTYLSKQINLYLLLARRDLAKLTLNTICYEKCEKRESKLCGFSD